MIFGFPTLKGGAGASGGDPYWADVLLLLMGDGTNGSTTIADSSSFARTMFAGGSTSIVNSTSNPKLGTGAISGQDTGNPFLTHTFTDLNATYNEWTVDAWVRRRSPMTRHGIMYANTGNLVVNVDGSGLGGTNTVLIGTPSLSFATTSALPLNTYAHIAVSVQFTGPSTYTGRVFFNGVLEATGTALALILTGGTQQVRIGQSDSAGFGGFNCDVDMWRLTRACRWTSGFTPPSTLADYGL